jgi:hypothetical protein
MTLNTATRKTTDTYEPKQGAGKGTLELEQAGDEIVVAGKDNALSAKPFHMTWKKRRP